MDEVMGSDLPDRLPMTEVVMGSLAELLPMVDMDMGSLEEPILLPIIEDTIGSDGA
jgi:hypothetical protein